MVKLFVYMFFTANLMYCLAYVVRDILWLRILTIVAALCTFPYFYFQEVPLYSALFWQTAFIVINTINLTILILERRPVYLTNDQKRLHLLLSRSFTSRELLKLLAIADWKEAKTEEKLIEKGACLEKLQLIFRGMVKVEVDGEIAGYIQDGGFAGEMSFASGEPTSADVIAIQPTRYLCWQKNKLESFFDKQPRIKDTMWTLLGCDMAAKLRTRT
ncbi:cyclic nucleotide-binding domain-containing protein [Candidatus Latescibacterota bacterium]